MYNNMVSLDTTYDIEYRKANGIYYTPEVIVEYMVRETVGRLIEDKCPEEINGISIVDPACGDGNFLVGAYKYLVEYHRKWYDEHKDVDEYKSDWYIKDGINGSGNIMRKAIPNCLTTNGIEGFVVSPVRIPPKGYYPYKQVS